MRYLLLSALFLSFLACTTTKDSEATATTPPSGLEGPAYDPATSPQPMTATTVLPQPPGAVADQPAAYGGAGDAPASYGGSAAPVAYEGAGQEAAVMAAKGSAAAPTTYSNGVAVPPTGPAAALAANLTGLWVNAADEREVVEFTPDHYSTFYDGEMLFQEAMRYHADCPGDCSGGEPLGISCFTIPGPAGTDCYGILRLTPEVLELSLLGVSTETITYYKK